MDSQCVVSGWLVGPIYVNCREARRFRIQLSINNTLQNTTFQLNNNNTKLHDILTKITNPIK